MLYVSHLSYFYLIIIYLVSRKLWGGTGGVVISLTNIWRRVYVPCCASSGSRWVVFRVGHPRFQSYVSSAGNLSSFSGNDDLRWSAKRVSVRSRLASMPDDQKNIHHGNWTPSTLIYQSACNSELKLASKTHYTRIYRDFFLYGSMLIISRLYILMFTIMTSGMSFFALSLHHSMGDRCEPPYFSYSKHKGGDPLKFIRITSSRKQVYFHSSVSLLLFSEDF